MRILFTCVFALIPIVALSQSGGDAYRGAAVIEKENCIQCHSIQGKGGKAGPDLGIRTSHQYTPAVMTSVMWNHAPAMWSAMEAKGVKRPVLTDREATDLFAYFYSVRYFEKPGEAGRGLRLFVSKHCAECHAVTGDGKGPGNPVRSWTSMSDPAVLVAQMWNHSSFMKRAFEAKGLGWVSLSGQDLVDLTVYIQNMPAMRRKPSTFSLPGPEGGEALFKEKGCAACHTSGLDLSQKLANNTLSDVAAAMWNHAPRMKDAPVIKPDEMRQVISYVWEQQYMGASGNAVRGQKVFESKRCATCHTGQGDAPSIGRGERVYSPVTMVTVLWKHGPAMLQRMQQKSIQWPRLSPNEVSDLVAFLNTKS